MSTNLTDVSNARIDDTDVTGGGFTTELDPSAINEHIATAHDIVEDRLAGKGLSEDRLARIELFVARHSIRFTIQGERQVDDESDPVASRTYSGTFTKEELRATSPGQQALMLDPTGDLASGERFDQFFTMG